MRKIIFAPDKFKSCMTAPQVCSILTAAFQDIFPGTELLSLPMADGGDGTVESILAATGGERVTVRVTGPLGKKVDASFGLCRNGECAVLEMASASGIALLDRTELDPLHATTYGTGELIKAALDRGVKEIVLGIGGSATVDGGAGMAQALGYRLLDENGADLPFGGSALLNLKSIDASQADPRLFETRFRVACDVTSPLLGPTGSAAVFGPQKGASPDDVILLEKALSVLNDVWLKQNMLTPSALPGDGAAGGLGAGLRAFCNAHPESGAHLVMDTLELERHLEGADLVITGEGCTDSQTGEGKLCGELAKKAHACGVKVLLLSGALEGRDEDYIPLFDYAFSTSTGRADLSEILAHGPEDLYFTARNIARLLKK